MRKTLLSSLIWLTLLFGLGVGFERVPGAVTVTLWNGQCFQGKFLSYDQGIYNFQVQGRIVRVPEERIQRLILAVSTSDQGAGAPLVSTSRRPIKLHITSDYDSKTPLTGCQVFWDGSPGPRSLPPGKHRLRIIKPGYRQYSRDIYVSADKTPLVIQCCLTVAPRPLCLRLTAQTTGKSLQPDQVVIGQQAYRRNMFVKPGKYRLQIQKQGFVPVDTLVTIPPGTAPYVLQQRLSPCPLPVKLSFQDRENPQRLVKPDKIFLRTPKGFQLWHGEPLLPGQYEVMVQKEGYYPLRCSLQVARGRKIQLAGRLVPRPRKIKLRLFTSSDAPQAIAPSQCTLNGLDIASHSFKPGEYLLAIKANGYYAYKTRITIPPGSSDFELPQQLKLEPKPRLVRIEISHDVPPQAPVAYCRISLSKPHTHKVLQLRDGLAVPPGPYRLYIHRPGYHPISAEAINITPSEEPYVIRRRLIAKPRKIRFRLQANFPQGVWLRPDAVFWDGEALPLESKIAPGFHELRLYKDGYHPLNQKVFIRGGKFPYIVSGKLQTVPRKVLCKILGCHGEPLTKVNLKIAGCKHRPNMVFEIDPGEYPLEVQAPYYHKVRRMLLVPPGHTVYTYCLRLQPFTRAIQFEITGEFAPQQPLQPDLISLNGQVLAKRQLSCRPGNYCLVVKKSGYKPLVQKIRIPVGAGTYKIKARLSCKPRQLFFEITSDFPREKLQPDSVLCSGSPIKHGDWIKPGVYALRIYKKGYLVKWLLNTRILPAETPYIIRTRLQSRPRRVIYEIRDARSGMRLVPGEITLDGQVVSGRNAFLPGRRFLKISKPGYQSIERYIIIPPDKFPYFINIALQPIARKLKFLVTGEFPPDIPIIPHQILLNGKPYRGEAVPPGRYELKILHPGYFPLEEYISVAPGTGPYTIQRILCTKPVKVLTAIAFVPVPPQDQPYRVTLQSVDTSGPRCVVDQQRSFKPGYYLLQISSPGYVTQQWKLCLRPSERPFTIRKVLTPELVSVQCQVHYAISPPAQLAPPLMKLIEKDGVCFYELSARGTAKVMPGEYVLEIKRPGYQRYRRKVCIALSPHPVIIKACLQACPRPLAIIFRTKSGPVQPKQLIVDHLPFDRQRCFPAGQWIAIRARFTPQVTNKLVERWVYITPGPGPLRIEYHLSTDHH